MPAASSSSSPILELADIAANARSRSAGAISPIALEAVTRIDAIFDVERTINGTAAEAPLATRREEVAPLVVDLEAWIRSERARLSRHAPVAKAMDYMLKRWGAFRPLPRGRPHLSYEQRGRAGAPRHCPWTQGMALRRL